MIESRNYPTGRPGGSDDHFVLGDSPDASVRRAEVPRLFVREAGWKVGVKPDSERAYCHVIAPGEATYHRIASGEVFLHRGDERVCVPCANRLGLLDFGPKSLRSPSHGVDMPKTVEEATGYALSNSDPGTASKR